MYRRSHVLDFFFHDHSLGSKDQRMMFHALYDIVIFCRVIVEGRGGGSVDHMHWDLCTAHCVKTDF